MEASTSHIAIPNYKLPYPKGLWHIFSVEIRTPESDEITRIMTVLSRQVLTGKFTVG